ncbi:MAG: AAA family ATPase [Spirochaetaceae bacterium]|jgi:MoxR-like ATPase|nr:AAA family ATPase [Spirochaetaceae bacterium]
MTEQTKTRDILRLPAERLYAEEIGALKREDKDPIPEGWQMSPKAALKFIAGGKAGGLTITPKYIGHTRLVEISIATLLTDRALLLIGEPGTAKSWLSENLAAAIYNDSAKVVQGTAGTSEEQIRYSWNYAILLAEGPSDKALIKSPIMTAMETGSIARIEEISRCQPEVQDALISILSEKNIAVNELRREVSAKRGFSLIATANTRDKGVNEMSAALKRRFNIVILPAPANLETEIEIVKKRVKDIAANYSIAAEPPTDDAVAKVVTVFRELRNGQTLDAKQKIKPPSGAASTAEAISLLANAMALAGSFGDGAVQDADIAAGLTGAVIKDEEKDAVAWSEYLENIMKKRGLAWMPLYKACREFLPG